MEYLRDRGTFADVPFDAIYADFVANYPSLMGNKGIAGDFRALVLQDGTGSIADMLREGWRLPAGPTAVPSPDAFSALAQDSVVTVDDAWYVSGPTPENDPALERMERAVFLQL